MWIADFSATVIGCIAPAGQTCEHLLHSGRQYPRSYDISGCISLVKSVDGRSTPLGHADTHSWQPVQCWAKCRRLNAPGGSRWVLRVGIFLSSITASPPSTVFSCAFSVAVTAMTAVVAKKLRREADVVFSSLGCEVELALAVAFDGLSPYFIAPCLQLPMQFMQSTQRL